MTFDDLSNAAKLYFMVYLTEWPCTYSRMRKVLFDAGVRRDDFRQAMDECDAFIAHCHELSQQAKSRRKHAEQKGRI